MTKDYFKIRPAKNRKNDSTNSLTEVGKKGFFYKKAYNYEL